MIGALEQRTLVVALTQDQETEVKLPRDVREFQLQARDGTVMQIAFAAGQVGTPGLYWTIKAGTVFQSGRVVPLTTGAADRKVYLRAVGAGTTAEFALVV